MDISFGDTVGDLGNLQDGIDFGGDPPEFAGALERGNPLTQVVVSQKFLELRRSIIAEARELLASSF
jgi:hypothetical protein